MAEAIQRVVSNQSRSAGDVSQVLEKLVNLTSNSTIISIRDIKSVVEYMLLPRLYVTMELNQAVLEAQLISNILSVNLTVVEGASLRVIGSVLKDMVSTTQRLCGNHSVNVPQFSLTCAGWFNTSDGYSILEINKDAGLLAPYRKRGQVSDFMIMIGSLQSESAWDSITTPSDTTGTLCAVVDIDSGVADKDKCRRTGPSSCECFYNYEKGMVIVITQPSRAERSTFLLQTCHVGAIAILALVILGLLCKGPLSDPYNAINLNIAITALVAQTVFLALTLPLNTEGSTVPVVLEGSTAPLEGLRLKSCLMLHLVSDYIHPTVLGWSLASCLVFLFSLDPVYICKSQEQGHMMAAKIALLTYLLPLLFPVSHWIYCSIVSSTTSLEMCFMTNSSCWSSSTDMSDVTMVTDSSDVRSVTSLMSDARLYFHFIPITLLLLSHVITVLAICRTCYAARNREGFTESVRRLKFLLLSTVPLCTCYAIHCTCIITGPVAALYTALAVGSVVFALFFGIGVIGSIKSNYYYVQFQVYQYPDDNTERPRVSRTAA